MYFDIKRVKIFVTAPIQYLEILRDSVCDAGAGIIGEYKYCTFYSKGVGTFIPSSNANPFIGEKNKLEFVKECKLEFVCDIKKVKQVISSLKNVHPYEEPAIDIVPLIDENYLDNN